MAAGSRTRSHALLLSDEERRSLACHNFPPRPDDPPRPVERPGAAPRPPIAEGPAPRPRESGLPVRERLSRVRDERDGNVQSRDRDGIPVRDRVRDADGTPLVRDRMERDRDRDAPPPVRERDRDRDATPMARDRYRDDAP